MSNEDNDDVEYYMPDFHIVGEVEDADKFVKLATIGNKDIVEMSHKVLEDMNKNSGTLVKALKEAGLI